ncbi:MAG: hypothetical protein H6767_03190 [Candidatus Peribacteria bacterium]|nr:MAG: hypothetical protein H6767_03190 [Candidatus Peribacteria bacterium]
MTAGRGIEHSEENKGDEAVHLYQIWCKTRQTGLEPRYQNHKFPLKSNTCTLLVS